MNKNWKNIEIKGLEDDDLVGKYSLEQLNRIENGLNAVASGQLASICSDGGKAALPKGVYTDTQRKGNEVAYELGVGIHNKNNSEYKKWKSEAGKKGGKHQVENGLGIHTDSETRKQWSRLGGLAVIDKLNEYKVCPHCGIKTRGAAYNRWHGNNCKQKK
jgi:hypothetical protein